MSALPGEIEEVELPGDNPIGRVELEGKFVTLEDIRKNDDPYVGAGRIEVKEVARGARFRPMRVGDRYRVNNLNEAFVELTGDTFLSTDTLTAFFGVYEKVEDLPDLQGRRDRPEALFPDSQHIGMDPSTGDIVLGTFAIDRTDTVVAQLRDLSGNGASLSFEWTNTQGDSYGTEAPSAVQGTTDGGVRLIRKGPDVKVTLSTSNGANDVNVYIDANA